MEAKGNEGTVRLLSDSVVLEFGGISAHAVKKKASPRSIPLSELIAIEINKGRRLSPNNIRFRRSDAAAGDVRPDRDPDTMCFISDRHGAVLGQLVAAVAAQTGVPVSGELAHLAVLPSRPEEELDTGGLRADVTAAASKMGWKLGGRREIKNLHQHLSDGETVERIVQGTYEGDQGVLVLTSHRLVFLFHGVVRQKVEDFPYDRISSVQTEAGFGTGSLVIYASGNNAKISAIVKQDLMPLADDVRQRIGAPRNVPGPPPTTPASDPIEQIKKLAELRDAGALSEEEFEAKKSELLKRL